MPRPTLAAVLIFALAACGDSGADAPGEVSPGEAQALDDAASMLDERQLPPEALPTAVPDESGDAPAEMTGDAAPTAR